MLAKIVESACRLSEGASTAAQPRICFVAPHAYPALSGRSDLPHIGGAEVQQALIGRVLAQRGWSVCFVTQDHGQPDAITHDGITVYRTARRGAGWPGLRGLHPGITKLWHALARAKADIYYQRAAGTETGLVALWCRLRRKAFVFAAASDTNCDPSLPDLKRCSERILYRIGIRRADKIVAQTRTQAEAFDRGFQLPTTLIRSCAPDPFDGRTLHRVLTPETAPRLLWVGRFHHKKRLEWFLDLAERLPEFACDIVGEGRRGDSYADALVARARKLSNVTLHGRVSHAEMGRFYDQSALLVCTSPKEGFPNTFLEAWSRGTPTLSTVDPDGIINSHGLGAMGASVAALREAALSLLVRPDTWSDCSQRARRYYLNNHSVSAAAEAYEALFAQLKSIRA